MDIGKILRDRAKILTFRVQPKKIKSKRWGIYPSVKVKQDIFFEENEFVCPVSLFSYDREEILKMQDEAIVDAHKGMEKDGWKFWLHAANHSIKRVGKLYRADIRFVFKVKTFLKIQEEVK